MPIRREDKEFIQALSLLGALFGACIGMFAVVHLSDRAKETYNEHTEYTQTHAALFKLKTSVVNPSNPISDDKVLSQVQQHIPKRTGEETIPKKSFWVDIPRWGYIGLCGAGGIGGAILGYNCIWILGWTGSIIVLYFIRGIYKVIGTVSPNSNAARQPASDSESGQKYYDGHARSQERILPTLVKLTFLLAFVLTVIAAIVWRLTAI